MTSIHTLHTEFTKSFKHLIPFLTLLFSYALSLSPTSLFGLTEITPDYALITIFFWTLYRPDLLNSLAIFALTFMVSILTGTHLGLDSLVCLIMNLLTLATRRALFTKSFKSLWAAFTLLFWLCLMLKWLIFSSLSGDIISIKPILFHFLMTTAIFPLLFWVYVHIQRKFLRDL